MNNRLVVMSVLIIAVAVAALLYANRKIKQMVNTANQRPSLTAPSGKVAPVVSPSSPTTVGQTSNGGVRPLGYGLTVGLANDPRRAPETVSVSCRGEPSQVDRPYNDGCNPQQGDTSCRTVLPVLCMKQGTVALPPNGDSSLYPGWMGGSLAATQPVMGAILESETYASAMCEAEYGPGWRMAEYVEAGVNGGMQGVRSSVFGANNRLWVLSKTNPANCWNSAP